jgi:hypothetical protein
MAIRAAAGTPDQPTLGAATSHYRIKTTYSELSRGAFQQPARGSWALRVTDRNKEMMQAIVCFMTEWRSLAVYVVTAGGGTQGARDALGLTLSELFRTLENRVRN